MKAFAWVVLCLDDSDCGAGSLQRPKRVAIEIKDKHPPNLNSQVENRI